MSRRRRRHSDFHTPSLVPLADMLTNTVGIMVFILIFTVLTAGGAIAIRRLPMEHEANVPTVEDYICMNGKIYPFRDSLVDKVLDPVVGTLKTQETRSRDDIKAFAERANGASGHDAHLKLSLKVEYYEYSSAYGAHISLICEPTDDGGLYAGEVGDKDSFFRHDVEQFDSKRKMLRFFVKPDAIDAFVTARDLAVQNGFQWNWVPMDPNKPITIGIGGGGSDGIHRVQ